ncbi:MAG: transposase [Pseudomonadota bacterium]|nr:transposase [Pseudomonadota bacterium]MEA3411327.1 transposase [Pseudomonadota bacterium]
MSNYIRAFVPGGCFFFTVVTHARQPFFANGNHVDRLREAFRRVMEKHPFAIDAIVILPDHLHTIWRLPDDDSDFGSRWRLIKHFVASGIEGTTNRRGEKQVWQRRFWEHVIRNDEDWRNHMDYIHYNPVKHGYTETPAEWRYSSFLRSVDKGWYEPDWGSAMPANIEAMELE